MTIKEPIHFLFAKYGIYANEIERIVSGRKYTALMLKNGNIGVCANFGNLVDVKIPELENPKLSSLTHRVVLTAYYNAKFNYNNNYYENVDIFDRVDFKKYNNITMIGLFKPLVKKFNENNLSISIFDLLNISTDLTPINKEFEFVSRSDAIIQSSTTIFNRTFLDLVNSSKKKCDIFLLGPSSIMHPDIFFYKNIKIILGSVFNKFDERVLNLIEEGMGTRKFLKLGKKVCIMPQ